VDHNDCLDGPSGCEGEVFERLSRSGSGMRFPRCESHYISYAEQMDAKHAETRRRYPSSAPADFDPSYVGERWDEDY
jgi:hypothetical protein